MIIRSRWRRAGGLAVHLGRTDTNEHVRIRTELCRHAPEDTFLALSLFAGISRTNPRVVRELIHIKVSPAGAQNLSDSQIARVIDLIEREHRIPTTTPQHVAEHGRGPRADHFHVVYPVVDPATGAAIRSNKNFLADEIACRLAELALGERIIPGPRQKAVVEDLKGRGLTAEATNLAAYAPMHSGNRVGDRTRQQAAGRAGDAEILMNKVFAAWQRAQSDLSKFLDEITAAEVTIVRGDRVVLAMDAAGIHVPLVRALRQKAKAAGQLARIRESDFHGLADGAATVPVAREESLRLQENAAEDAVRDELTRMAGEAELDGQRQLAERLRVAQEHHRRRQRAGRRTAAARRREILAAYARRDRIRRARVARSFLLAGLMDKRELRTATFVLAATGVVLAGGGLGLALIAAGTAIAVLPTRERARAVALDARLQRKSDQTERDRDLEGAYREIAQNGSSAAPGLRFSDVPRASRALAGYFAHLMLDQSNVAPKKREMAAAIIRVLGPLAPAIEATLVTGNGRSGLAVLRWYNPSDVRHQRAAAAAMERGGEWTAAARLRPRHVTPRKRDGWER